MTPSLKDDIPGGAPAPALAAPQAPTAIPDREATVPPNPCNTSGGSPAPATGKPDFALSQRKHPVHLPNIHRFNQPVILFVTVCTQERRPILADRRVHEVLTTTWPGAVQYRVGRYMVMPDNVHLFCAPAVLEPENVKCWVAYWKRLASIELKDLQPLWQRDCWDTQLRDATHYGGRWEYVAQNPVRKGLVARPEDWPYQGCLNELRW